MRILFVILSLSFLLKTDAQSNTTRVQYKNEKWFVDYFMTIDVNRFMPTAEFINTLNDSFGVGLYFGLPISNRFRIELGTSLFFPDEKQTIRYFNEGEILEGGPGLSGALGFWGTHVTPLKDNLVWDKRIGFGLGFFQTDIETGNPEEDNDSVYGAETLFLSIGTGIRARVYRRNVGFKLEYFFVPYNLFKKHFESGFGSSYLTLGLSFGF